MESRFAHLRERDSSVSMLRVKMSRRRSQSQKENRERTVNNRRQLHAVEELEISSLDAFISKANMPDVQEKTLGNAALPKHVAGEDRLKQLQRWKERKALEKEKEKREKERKGVFKTGLYHPKDTLTIESLPPVTPATGRAKGTKVNQAPSPSTRVTRSMKQHVQKPLTMQDVNTAVQSSAQRKGRACGTVPKPAPTSSKTKVQPTAHGLLTRSANKPLVTAVPVVKGKPKDKCANVRTTRSKAVADQVAPSPVKKKKSEAQVTFPTPSPEESVSEPETKLCPLSLLPHSEEDDIVVDQTVADSAPAEDVLAPTEEESLSSASFAPKGFQFKAPIGLSFKFEPLTLCSADTFQSSSFTLPPAPTSDNEPEPWSKPSPPKSPRRTPSTVADPSTEALSELKHDVPHFRSEIANETNKLTALCVQWESKVEDESIPEEMRDRMRTAVGQARLLMKERFKQFSGLVDDCEFGRGEKMTTCTDLEGFWDMVYFQVEDVNKKFDALKEAEARCWVEEYKPPTRQRKVVKKPAAAPAKGAATKAAAGSRLAAAKAAMKARQQAAETEKAAQAESTEQDTQEEQAEARRTDTVVLQIESPAKPTGSVRRSTRLSAAVLPQPSSSNYLTPRRVTRQSLALAHTPVQTSSNPQPTSPCHPCPVNKTPAEAPRLRSATPHLSMSLCFTPVNEVSSDTTDQMLSAVVSELGHSIPAISVEALDEPAQALRSALDQCPQLSQSLCKSPTDSHPPVPTATMSFALSPCMAQLSSPTVSCTLQAVQNILKGQDSMGSTPDSSINEGIPGVYFERGLQPLQRDSLSPKQPSPVATNVEMESPRDQIGGPLTQQETASTTLPEASTLFSSQSPQTVESAMLLFTQDLKDQIRQSVCPTDLMTFTSPL